jgi:hypothetical protein
MSIGENYANERLGRAGDLPSSKSLAIRLKIADVTGI